MDTTQSTTPAGGRHRRTSVVTRTIAVIAAVAMLAACGGVGSGGDETAETKTVETIMGPVEAPVDPQRIVSLDINASLQVLDELGAPLVGTQTRTDGVWEELSDRAQDLPSVWVRGEDVDLEAIIALEPDLIVGDGNEDLYEQLSAIAPALLIDTDGDWIEHMRVLADVVNRSERAEELIAEVEERVPELEEAIGERWPDGVQVTLLRVRDDIRILQSADRNSSSAHWLVNRIDAIGTTGDLRQVEDDNISPEQLREADGDVILYFGGGGGSDATQEEGFLSNAINNPLWDGLSAVEADRAHVVDSDLWWGGSNGVTAAHLAIDDLFEYVAEAP